jgi:5-methylcytosine-specific restriction protein A
MIRREFNAKIMIAEWDAADGRCRECGPDSMKLAPGNYFFDHIIPDALGGEPVQGNCQLLCRNHHEGKTRKADVPRIAKAKRQQRRHLGIKKPTTFRGWRRFGGAVVYANDRSK